jgi:hypothetical protein
MRAEVNCRVGELAIALQVLAVTICKCSVNTTTNPNRSDTNACAVVFQSTMFSSLASYLLGNQSHEPDLSPDAGTAVGLRAVEGDDDWVLVERTGAVLQN